MKHKSVNRNKKHKFAATEANTKDTPPHTATRTLCINRK